MPKTHVNPASLFPSVEHGFSQVVVASGANTVFLSGQTAWDADKRIVGRNHDSSTSRAFSMNCSVEIEIRSNAEIVWNVLTDARGFPRWNSTVTGIEGHIREGERLRLHVPGTNRDIRAHAAR